MFIFSLINQICLTIYQECRAERIAREADVKKLVLTHLPQFGDLEQLRREAQDVAGEITTELAKPHKTWDFNTF